MPTGTRSRRRSSAATSGRRSRLSVVERARQRRDLPTATAAVEAELAALLVPREPGWEPRPAAPGQPAVVLVVGVNGTGKTTTIGKLAARYRAEGRVVILAAADTFRAAAIEQLQAWATRAGVTLVAHAPGADPGAVVYDTLDAAVARGADLVIADTAGRLHTKVNLMDELSKIRRIIDKRLPGREPETLFVLDATTGQNGLAQAKAFHAAVGLTGIVLTKLDSTAKGGIVFAIEHDLGIPVRFVGVGETGRRPHPLRPRHLRISPVRPQSISGARRVGRGSPHRRRAAPRCASVTAGGARRIPRESQAPPAAASAPSTRGLAERQAPPYSPLQSLGYTPRASVHQNPCTHAAGDRPTTGVHFDPCSIP